MYLGDRLPVEGDALLGRFLQSQFQRLHDAIPQGAEGGIAERHFDDEHGYVQLVEELNEGEGTVQRLHRPERWCRKS